MSFSSECKEELCRVPTDKGCCRTAELAALYMTVGTLSLLGRGMVSVQFSVESAAVARRIFVLLQKQLNIVAQIHYVTHARFGGVRKCVLTLGPKQTPELLAHLGMMETDANGAPSLKSAAPRTKLNRDCCRRAFLRGAMLGCGTVSNPELGYHMEFVTRGESLRLAVAKCLQSIDVPVKQTERKDGVSLYCKRSDHIAAILTAMGAHQAVMALEKLRVERQVYGNIKRALNCDAANLNKTLDAGEKQVNLIARLMKSDRFGTLPPALQEIARARLNAPDMSLTELGATLKPPIGKSGVNHRMRRLMELAREEVGEADEAVEIPRTVSPSEAELHPEA